MLPVIGGSDFPIGFRNISSKKLVLNFTDNGKLLK